MALNFSTRSLMNYGLEINALNQYLDFQAVNGITLTAIIPLGFYSLTGLATAIALAMQSADVNNNYSVTVNRNLMGGTQNRYTISTTGTFLSLLFLTGPNANTSIASVIGFNPTDYLGQTSYIGSTNCGTNLIPTYVPYNYLDDYNIGDVFGAVNIAASGLKESVVFNIQQFIQLEFMYEDKTRLPEWRSFWYWAIQQRPFDFIPQISDPSVVYQVTLEKTERSSQGLGFQMREMLPNFPNMYQTGSLTFRIIAANQNFITGT